MIQKQQPFKTRAALSRALAPRSIAVVGASNRPGSFGQRTIENLAGYGGRVFLVSKGAVALAEGKTYPSVSDLPEVPDCVVLCTPGESAEPLVAECAAAGVGGVIVYASGFAETGEHEKQQRLTRIAADSGMAVFGPNCLGVANHTMRMVLSFADFSGSDEVVERGVGVVSQSGAVGIALSQARKRGVSISHVFTFGNGCDVDSADLISYLVDEPGCAAIACVFEGSANPLRIVEAARLALARNKVVVMYKTATGEQGALAAMSHTGSLAGSDSAYRAVLKSVGVVLVDSLEALLETASFFAKAPAPKARGAAIVSSSGGTGIMATDKAEEQGVALPQPGEATLAILKQHIPSYGSTRNPCDLTAQVLGNPESLSACCNAFAADDSYGVLVTTQPWAAPALAARVGVYEAVARRSGKPVCTVWMSEWHEGPGASDFERNPLVPVFHSLQRCFAAVAAWHWRDELSRQRHTFPAIDPSAAARVKEMLSQASSPTLTERDAKRLLALYGVPVVSDVLVTNASEAIGAAETCGYPLVLKIESADLPHKSDVGGVRLNIRSQEDLLREMGEMVRSVKTAVPTARIDGVLVQPMVSGGVEVIVGAKLDPQFGPLLVVGLGGIFVELIDDVSVAPVPVSREQALAMLAGLRGAKALQGARGLPKVDLARLADIVSRISRLVEDLGEGFLELDVNPLICGHNGNIHAVDALVVRRMQATAEQPEGVNS